MSKLRVLDLFSGYTIREDGEIRSRFGRVIKHQLDTVGYARVELWTDGVGRKHLVHRLLAQTFIRNPDDKPQVNHIDGDKRNNSLSNLEWVTQSENQLHAYRTGLQVGYRKPMPLSTAHRSALCGSRWRGERRVYHAGSASYQTPGEAAQANGVSRQTFYNRAASPRFPEWHIELEKEVESK